MAERMLTAMYDDRASAEKARDGLVRLGIPADDITIRGREASTPGTADVTAEDDRGFWGSLKDAFLPDEDRHAYAEGLHRGGHMLHARVPEGREDEALDVLDRSGAIDMDERSESWKSSGWSGQHAYASGSGGQHRHGTSTGSGSVPGLSEGQAGYATTKETRQTATGVTGAATGTATGERSAGLRTGDRDDKLQVAEEELRIGKREVGRGGVRVRSYVRERPVEESVTLRDERVHVERRPVDRAARPGDAVFEEREISATARGEEAVVSKEARVKEEITLRKEADTRTETVRDTVREQHVEVEDDRGAGHAHGAGLTGETRIGTTEKVGTGTGVGTTGGTTERTTKTTDRTGH